MIRAMLILCLTGLGVATALLLGGCATFDAQVSPEYRRQAVNVAWIESTQVPKLCQRDTALACATPEADPCQIVTYPNPAFDVLGHELAHCFKGRFHPERKAP